MRPAEKSKSPGLAKKGQERSKPKLPGVAVKAELRPTKVSKSKIVMNNRNNVIKNLPGHPTPGTHSMSRSKSPKTIPEFSDETTGGENDRTRVPPIFNKGSIDYGQSSVH
jgi:hypothetical protein